MIETLPIASAAGLESTRGVGPADQAAGPDFAGALEAALDDVDAAQDAADAKIEAFVAGEDVPVHEVMIEVAKAEATMQLATNLTRRAIDAYQEIARMQI